jgi:hypothetical protein
MGWTVVEGTQALATLVEGGIRFCLRWHLVGGHARFGVVMGGQVPFGWTPGASWSGERGVEAFGCPAAAPGSG